MSLTPGKTPNEKSQIISKNSGDWPEAQRPRKFSAARLNTHENKEKKTFESRKMLILMRRIMIRMIRMQMKKSDEKKRPRQTWSRFFAPKRQEARPVQSWDDGACSGKRHGPSV